MQVATACLAVFVVGCSAARVSKPDPGLALVQLRAGVQANAALEETSSKPKSAPKVVYAVFTSGRPAYRSKLEALMETWAAKPIKEGRFIAIAGRTYPKEWQSDHVVAVDCDDGTTSLSCKEAMLLVEGAKRGADWLFISGEDNYVDTDRLEQLISTQGKAYSPESKVALGCLGCGYGNRDFCEGVQTKSGFCGGCGYAISRGTLAQMTANGTEALVNEYGGHGRQKMPNDMSTSCALYERGVDLHYMTHLMGGPTFGMKDFQRSKDMYAVFHYVSPEVMRWYHGLKQGLPAQEMAKLQDMAFDRGCAWGMDTKLWHDHFEACLEEHNWGINKEDLHLLAFQHLAAIKA